MVKMNKKIIIGVTIIILLLIIIFGTNLIKITNIQESENNNIIKIGGIFGLSGFSSEWGEGELRAVEFAVNEINNNGGINGKQIKLIVEDTQTDGIGTINAFNKLINIDKIKYIIGSTWLETYIGGAEIAEKNKIITISPSSSVTSMKDQGYYKYIFSTWYRSDLETKEIVNHMLDNNISNVVLLFMNTAYWEDISNQFKINAKKNGLNVLQEFRFNANEVDFKTILTKVKQLNPDAIMFGVDDASSLIAFLKQKEELHMNSIQLFSESSLGTYGRDPILKEYLIGSKYASPVILDSEFKKIFYKQHTKIISPSVETAYDAIKILTTAIKEVGEDTDSVLNYLKTNNFNTITYGDKVSFDSLNGLTGVKYEIKTIN